MTQDLRLLATTWAGPPRIFQLCESLNESLGGEEKTAKVKLCDRAVHDATGSFLRGVLETVHLLMEHHYYVDSAGGTLKPDFGGSTRAHLSKFSIQTLVSAVLGSIDEDGISTSRQGKYALALWCDACSCPYVGPVCKHLLTARILRLV